MDLLEVLQNPALHLLCVKLSIDFSLGKLFIHLKFIMKINFFSLDKKVLLSFLFECLSVFEEVLLLFLEFADFLLVFSNFAQEFSVDLFFVEELEDQFLGVRDSSGDFDVFECHFYGGEFFHFVEHFSPQKVVNKFMSMKDFEPVLFVFILVLHGFEGNFLNLTFSDLI